MASSSPFLLGPSGFRRWLVFLLVLGISAKAGWWTSPLPISSVWIFKTITCLLVPVHAQCISILYPHALFATTTTANRNLSLLVLFTAIVNVLTPLLFTPIESAIMTLMPYKELLYEKVVTAKAASHHEFHAIQIQSTMCVYEQVVTTNISIFHMSKRSCFLHRQHPG